MATSICWKYFDVNPKIRIHLSESYVNILVVVKVFADLISRGGKSAKTFTTTNMLNHLRKIHPEEAKVADKKRKHNECSEQTFHEQMAATTSLQ